MNKLSLFIPEIMGAQKSKAIRVAGIDLGTTNSTTSEILWSPQQPGSLKTRCLEFPQRCADGQWVKSTLVPSVVAIQDEGVFIGQGAKQLRRRCLELGLAQNCNLFYECKNDMGIRKTYAGAPEGFQTAAEVGGKVLKFLHDSIRHESPVAISRTVVTVPASFQVAQRKDTLQAARLAGIDLDTCDLLDEPVAAFLDYLMLHREDFKQHAGQYKKLLVFDFGGGTCDVAIFSLYMPDEGFPVRIFPLAVSRYHRLGGGDIDRAIVHEVLIPRLKTLNDLSRFDLSYDDKKEFLEPALLGIAEELKMQLCDEITRLHRQDKLNAASRDRIVSSIPGIFTFTVRGMQLVINCPQLSAIEFDKLLVPFLDEDLLYARETDYRMVCSVFAPLQDALDRGRLDCSAIDYCLMLGGSSRIPQVIDAVKKFFSSAAMLTYADQSALQTAIARGAAFHGLTLELFGHGLVQPVCYDKICLRTESGTVELVPRGAELPFPGGAIYKHLHDIAVPKTSLTDDLELKVEILAGDENRCLYRSVWQIPAPVNKGDPLCIRYRYDESQMLDLCLMIEDSDEFFTDCIENPLTHVVNPQKAMLRALEIEEELLCPDLAGDEAANLMLELGDQYAELGQKEKAISVLKKALNKNGGPDEFILNQLGTCCRDIGDFGRAEKFYREAMKASPWTGPAFNLALMQRRNGQHPEAIETMDGVIRQKDEGSYLVLRAQLASDTGSSSDHTKYLASAFTTFGPLEKLSDWALGWYLTGAEEAKDADKIEAAKAEQKRRREKKEPDLCPGAVLPAFRQGMQLKMQFS
jgi:molecular chaperone DnaK